MMIKLIYFDFNFWRVDILRLCLSYSSIPYELQRIKRQDWKKKKNQFPFGQLPVMQVNNQFFSHTHSLAKFCANQASLYEQDEFKMLIVDQVLDWANEITNHIAPSIRAAMREKNFEKSRELRKEFIKNDLKRWFYYLENLLKRSSENKDFFTKLANETPYSRFPVWENNSENIIGIMYVKDLLRSLLLKKFDAKKVLQEPWFVPETTSLLGQLNEFREKQKQMAFVVDEYGVLLGLVTLEDILEEIVGQIEDEHDYPSSNLLYDNNGNIYVNGNVTIRDLNRKFNFKLPENSASTIAGLIINTAKRIPETGENFVIKDLIINIISRSQTRITKVLIKTNKT